MSLHYVKVSHIVTVTVSVHDVKLPVPKLDKSNGAVAGAGMLGCI